MNDAPLIFRIARWPIETIQGLQSPEFTRSVDAWLLEDDAIRDEGQALADALYPLVPLALDKAERARILAIRRALHRGSDPLPEPPLPQVAAHAERRTLHAAERARLEDGYAAALENEKAALLQIVYEPEFQKALCLASPAAFRELARAEDLNDWRLVRTLLQFVLRAAGRATPNGLWAGVALEDGPFAHGLETSAAPLSVRFAPRLKWPHRDSPELQALCIALSEGYSQLAPFELARELDRAREFFPASVPADEPVLAVDCLAPFRIRAAPALKQQIAAAIRLAWNFDRLGTGELDAAARRQAEFSRGGEAPDLTSPWEHELAPVFDRTRHRLPNRALAQPMPFGSALLRLDHNGSIRVGSITPDPALFYARFHRLFNTARFHAWYTAELDCIEAGHPNLRFADLVLHRPNDPNAASRPRFRPCLVDGLNLSGARIVTRPGGHARLHLEGSPEYIIPLISSAVSLDGSDPCTRKLAALSRLMGRPSLLCPLPVLPREREEWHHLPRLELSEKVVIGVERWTMPQATSSALSAAGALQRFLLWRRYVRQSKLPDLVYSFTGLEATESLLPCHSLLAIEALGRAIRGKSAGLRFQEAFPDPRQSWLTCESGKHYLVETAAAWSGDNEFWAGYTAASENV